MCNMPNMLTTVPTAVFLQKTFGSQIHIWFQQVNASSPAGATCKISAACHYMTAVLEDMIKVLEMRACLEA